MYDKISRVLYRQEYTTQKHTKEKYQNFEINLAIDECIKR